MYKIRKICRNRFFGLCRNHLFGRGTASLRQLRRRLHRSFAALFCGAERHHPPPAFSKKRKISAVITKETPYMGVPSPQLKRRARHLSRFPQPPARPPHLCRPAASNRANKKSTLRGCFKEACSVCMKKGRKMRPYPRFGAERGI